MLFTSSEIWIINIENCNPCGLVYKGPLFVVNGLVVRPGNALDDHLRGD